VVNLLQQVEVGIANGKTTAQSCKEALITEQTFYR
jgi:putative transposase